MGIKDGHTIEKLTFDIQIPSEKQFNYISDLISSITEHELNVILDAILNKYNIQDQTIRIPEITLDLENISETDTRQHIISQFKNGLEKWFEEKFNNNNYKTDKEIKTFSLSDREFNLIKHFITHGNIPWWGVNPLFLPDESLKKYIREESIKTKNLIFTLGKNKKNRKRIVYQFKDETLYQLFGILSPRPSSFFKQYATDLTEIHQKQKVVEEEDRAFKKVLQELILTYLISHTATSIDQTSFFKKQLLLLSKQYGISYKSILDRINEAVKTLPETYPQTFGIKNIVKELLKRDFLTITLPKPSKNLDFKEYNELLTLFYTSNPNQLVGKYKSKKERDRLIRLLLRQNKQKTFQLLSGLHRKFNISKVHTASLFSEGLLLEMMEIWHQPHLELANSMIDSFKYLNNKFFIFSNSNVNVTGIIYSHILSYSFAEKKSSSITASQIIKNITKTYSLNKEFLIRQFYVTSLSYSPKIKNKLLIQFLKDEQSLNIDFPDYTKLNLFQLKNILGKYLGANFTLFEELIKTVTAIHPSLKMFVSQPAFYIFLINKWIEKPEKNEHFPNFVDELITILSQKIPLESSDFYQSLLLNKKAISAKLFKAIQQGSKDEKNISAEGIKQILSDYKNYDNLDLPQLDNLFNRLLRANFPLFKELIKNVTTIHPSLKMFVSQPAFYIFLINKWMEKTEKNEHFPNFVDELITFLSQKIPLESSDFYQSLLLNKKAISSKLFKAIQQGSKDEKNISAEGIKQIFSDPINYNKLDLPQLKNILAKLLKGNYLLFEEFIKKVYNVYPSLKSFINQPAFYIFLINIVLLNQSEIYKIDHFLLKVMSKLANKSKTPIKTFIYPLLKTNSVIPDKLTKTLRLVYEKILEKNPTYAETVETVFKAAESIEKLINILGNSLFNDFMLNEDTDKTSLFLEVLLVQRELVLERLFEHKFNPAISFLIVNGLTEEALQFLQMSIAQESYNELINASNDLKHWFSRYNIIKLPRNKIGLWVKQNTLHFILLNERGKFKTADYYQFILEKLQKERILQLKELEKTIDNLPFGFQSEILDLISDQNNMPLPKAWRDNQFYNDVLIHYLLTGKIQGWLDNPYLEIKELYFIFNEALKSENLSLIKGILAIPMTNNILNRILSLIERTDPIIIIHLINKIFPQKSILSFYQSVYKIAEGFIISSELKRSIFIVFMQNKMWTIINPILRSEMITDGINKIYNTKIKLDEAEISGQSFKITWLQYYLESGFWPEGFPEEKISLYIVFLKSSILESPILLLNITENLSYHSFHQNILREIFSSKEIAFIFKEIVKLKNINSIHLENIIEIYLSKGNKYINEKKLEILFDSLLSLLLFERNQNISIDNQLMSDLGNTIPEINNIEKPKIKQQIYLSAWDKEIFLLDYYLTYGSIPIEHLYFDAEKWPFLIDNLRINAPRNLMYKLHFWSKTPYKINRLLELVSENNAISLISLINSELYEQIIFLEKLIDHVTGEKLRQKLGFKDEKTFIKNILYMWSKSQKIQPSPIPIIYDFFTMYIEKKRIQPNILLALIVEKVKNVSSKQINVIKSLQKYSKDTYVEKKIKKETPVIPKGLSPESIYIANAGLILLWPFLGRFFRRLNLVGAKEFIDESSRMRAILLIQYLVTGKKEAPEYELALNKLLCGAEMDLEIDMEIEITEEEINLSNSLLTGAITNWEKLKGTRIGTFRETFLQRNGSLYYMNNRWELKVEKKAYDLLLETLPWGIQMIQMSWMKERLVVLWR
jgi:hypothetical protein